MSQYVNFPSVNIEQRTSLVNKIATELGFAAVGISKAERLDEPARRLSEWLDKGHHGEMSWMANHFEKRVDPTKLVPGARSVVSLMYNYYSDQAQPQGAPQVASYAYGRDYHKVLKKKLKTLLERLREEIGQIDGRCFVDSAPVMEREWAQRGGLGWLGKNTLLLNRKKGSYYFLAELIIDLELNADHPIKDHCGTCTACIDACPTDAISPSGYVLDGSKCISYLTIELKENIPEEFSDRLEDWVFGCDICQDVCPWNRFSKPHSEPDFEPRSEFLEMDRSDWYEMTEELFNEVFKGTPLKRANYAGIRKNLRAIEPSSLDGSG